MLIGIKGTNWAQRRILIAPSRRLDRTGIPHHIFDFTKCDEMVLWLNYQQQFHEFQPDRDEVLLPWSFKGEVSRQFVQNPQVGNIPATVGRVNVRKDDVSGLKCATF